MTNTKDPRPPLMPSWLCVLCALLGFTGYFTGWRIVSAMAIGLSVTWLLLHVRRALWEARQ